MMEGASVLISLHETRFHLHCAYECRRLRHAAQETLGPLGSLLQHRAEARAHASYPSLAPPPRKHRLNAIVERAYLRVAFATVLSATPWFDIRAQRAALLIHCYFFNSSSGSTNAPPSHAIKALNTSTCTCTRSLVGLRRRSS